MTPRMSDGVSFVRRAKNGALNKNAGQTLPWLHTFIGNMKQMILGTYHSLAPKHLDDYLAEFVYRANRRWMEATLFDRLLVAAVTGQPMCNQELVTGDKQRFSL